MKIDATPAPVCAALPDNGPSGVVGTATDRDRVTGRFLRGNLAAMITGERSRQFWQAAEASRREMRRAYLAQRGFAREQDAPATLVAAADGAAQAVLLRNGAFERVIEAGGPVTTNDRQRAVVKSWENASDRAFRHLQVIGLESRESDVLDLSPAEWVAQQQERREAAQAGASDTIDTPGGPGEGGDS
jgi:hypothetical protein